MTPFGRRVRELRAARGVTLVQMAQALGVTPAYLSALEHGKRGQPTFTLIQGAIHHLGVIWDEADELIRLATLTLDMTHADLKRDGLMGAAQT